MVKIDLTTLVLIIQLQKSIMEVLAVLIFILIRLQEITFLTSDWTVDGICMSLEM